MVIRLLEGGVGVVAWNRSPGPRSDVAAKGAIVTQSVAELVDKLKTPRIIWLMLPAGAVIDDVINQLIGIVNKNDIVIDGGNSFYQDSIRRASILGKKHIQFLDVGVSGGPAGARNGACLMVGGDKKIFTSLKLLWEAIAAENAYGYVGKVGAGHFAKMVHNGIEYGMMEAIAEGATVLRQSQFAYNLTDVFRIYNRQSVIMSRLVGWTHEAFAQNQTLEGVSSVIAASGEGEWTVNEAKKLAVPVPIIERSLQVRLRSMADPEDSPAAFRNKIVSALRGKFGGHTVKR